MIWAFIALSGAAGLSLRSRLGDHFSVVFRGYMLSVGVSVSFLTGWVLRINVDLFATLGVLAAAELGALAAVRAAGRPPLLGTAAIANAGFWSVPVAALLNPAVVPVAVANSTLTSLRGAPLIRWLRTEGGITHSRRTAVADYAQATGLTLGLLAGRFAAAPGWAEDVVQAMAAIIGVFGVFVLTLALPSRMPRGAAFQAALPALAVRFGIPAMIVLAASLAGLSLSPVVWIVALAPAPISTMAWARVYGQDLDIGTAQVLLTAAAAVVLLPVVATIVS